MFDDELKKIWQNDLKEIRENKIRFAGLCISFIIAAGLLLTDDSGGEEIILTETPPSEVVETSDTNKNIVTIKRAENSNVNENIKIVIGANSDDLFVGDPFKVPMKEKIEKPPELPPVIISPPVAQVKTKFILRGIAIVGANKSAIVQKIIDNDKKAGEENLILGLGDNINGKKIVDIATDSVILEDGEILNIDLGSD